MYARAYPWDNRRKNWQETFLLGKNIIEMLAYCEDQSLATGSQICAVTTLGKKRQPGTRSTLPSIPRVPKRCSKGTPYLGVRIMDRTLFRYFEEFLPLLG